jgi:hypothetical protein
MFHYIFQQVFCKCSSVAVTVLYNSFTYAAGGADGWRRRRTRRTRPRGPPCALALQIAAISQTDSRGRSGSRSAAQRTPPYRWAAPVHAGLARSVTNTLTLIQRRGRWRRRGSGRRVGSSTGRRRCALCWKCTPAERSAPVHYLQSTCIASPAESSNADSVQSICTAHAKQQQIICKA